ncbi:MAG: SPOR domain-containing protein, partial [Campylobacter sp.]|nr:SPOR domain-containing protein [Campylobacter sp.]
MTDKFDMSDITMNGAPGDGTASLKKLLTIVAGIIVLFLIVLIIMKAINKNDIDTNAALTMPSEEELTKKEEVKKEPEIN